MLLGPPRWIVPRDTRIDGCDRGGRWGLRRKHQHQADDSSQVNCGCTGKHGSDRRRWDPGANDRYNDATASSFDGARRPPSGSWALLQGFPLHRDIPPFLREARADESPWLLLWQEDGVSEEDACAPRKVRTKCSTASAVRRSCSWIRVGFVPARWCRLAHNLVTVNANSASRRSNQAVYATTREGRWSVTSGNAAKRRASASMVRVCLPYARRT